MQVILFTGQIRVIFERIFPYAGNRVSTQGFWYDNITCIIVIKIGNCGLTIGYRIGKIAFWDCCKD